MSSTVASVGLIFAIEHFISFVDLCSRAPTLGLPFRIVHDGRSR
jgi:hypothetical protein